MTREIMIKSHQMTKEIKAQYPEVNYRTQLGICMSFVIKESNALTPAQIINKIEAITINKQVKVIAKEWKKGAQHRIYIEHSWKTSKEYKTSKVGYIDMVKKTFVESDNYGGFTAEAMREIRRQCKALIA